MGNGRFLVPFCGVGGAVGFWACWPGWLSGCGFWLVSGFLGWLVVFCIVVRVSVMLVFFVLVFVLLVILLFGFVVCKGVRWMPWYQGPMKGVVDCDMPRGVVERALIRGCPNGGTQPGLCLVTVF